MTAAAATEPLSALFERCIELPPEEREALLASLAESHPERAAQLQRLLEADAGIGEESEPSVPPVFGRIAGEIGALGEVGGFRLLRALGHGGMGEVWLAERAAGSGRQRVALKLLRIGVDDAARRHFIEEQRILASLNHPHVARLIDAGMLPEGLPWLAMEYVEGAPITEHCARERLSIEARLQLFLAVLGAVGHAHGNLVVHRDLKPSNVFVDPNGQPRLLDFGIAKALQPNLKATATADRYFSLSSAAPEHFSGEPCNVATDVYQLGLLLYELLCGVSAYRFDRLSPAEIERQVRDESPALPSLRSSDVMARQCGLLHAGQLARRLRGDLDRIVLHALRKRGDERYRSTLDFALDIEAFLEGRPVRAVGQGRAYRMRKFMARHALPLSAVAVALLLIIGLLVQLLVRDAELARAHAVAIEERDNSERVNRFLLDMFRAADPFAGQGPDLRKIVRQAWERQLASGGFSDPRVSLALIEAAIGLGEREAAQQMIDALSQRTGWPLDVRRELLLQTARLQSIEGNTDAVRATIDALALIMPGASEAQQVQYVGHLAQLLITSDPGQVVALTERSPVPPAWVRLRARALIALDRHAEAERLLLTARSGTEQTGIERLAIAQALLHLYLSTSRAESAEATGAAMLKEAREVLGDGNARLVPYANSQVMALATNNKLDEATQLLDEMLTWPDVADATRQRLYTNRLLIGTSQGERSRRLGEHAEAVLLSFPGNRNLRVLGLLAQLRDAADRGPARREISALRAALEDSEGAPSSLLKLATLWLRSMEPLTERERADLRAQAEAVDPADPRLLQRFEGDAEPSSDHR